MEAADLSSSRFDNVDPAVAVDPDVVGDPAGVLDPAGIVDPVGVVGPAVVVEPAGPVGPVAHGAAPPKHRRWSRAEDDRRNQRTVELLARVRDESLAEADRQCCLDLAVELNLPMAEALAWRYRSAGEDLDDLIQVARLGLIQALKRFNPDFGNFAAFAVPTIAGEIKRHFRDHFWSTPRPPRRLQELHHQANQAWSDLAQQTGHLPNTTELADRLGEPPDQVREAMATSPFNSASLDAPTDTVPAASERIGTPEPGFEAVEDALERAQLTKQLRRAIADLSPTDRLILHLRFGQNRKQSEIAAEIGGVSQMSISRRLTKIIHTLREAVVDGSVR